MRKKYVKYISNIESLNYKSKLLIKKHNYYIHYHIHLQ